VRSPSPDDVRADKEEVAAMTVRKRKDRTAPPEKCHCGSKSCRGIMF